MAGAFDVVFGVLAFDDPMVEPESSFWEEPVDEFSDRVTPEHGESFAEGGAACGLRGERRPVGRWNGDIFGERL